MVGNAMARSRHRVDTQRELGQDHAEPTRITPWLNVDRSGDAGERIAGAAVPALLPPSNTARDVLKFDNASALCSTSPSNALRNRAAMVRLCIVMVRGFVE